MSTSGLTSHSRPLAEAIFPPPLRTSRTVHPQAFTLVIRLQADTLAEIPGLLDSVRPVGSPDSCTGSMLVLERASPPRRVDNEVVEYSFHDSSALAATIGEGRLTALPAGRRASSTTGTWFS